MANIVPVVFQVGEVTDVLAFEVLEEPRTGSGVVLASALKSFLFKFSGLDVVNKLQEVTAFIGVVARADDDGLRTLIIDGARVVKRLHLVKALYAVALD